MPVFPLGKEFPILPGDMVIRYKGVFDFEGMYRHVHKWILSRQMDYSEPGYKDKTDSPFGNETEVSIEGDRNVTEFVKYKIKVSFHLWESKDITVDIDGKPAKRMQGRIEVRLNGGVTLDWQNRFEKHPLLQKFMVDVLLRREIEAKYLGPLFVEVQSLGADLKKMLNIQAV